MLVRKEKLKEYLKAELKKYFNLKVIKYILSDPNKLLYERYDSVVANALYGSTREFLMSDKVEILTIEDHLRKHNLEVTKRENIALPIMRHKAYSISILETRVLCMLAKSIKAKKIFEIGTFEGKTAANIAYNVGEETHIYTLDLPQKHCWQEVGKNIKENRDVLHKITLLNENSMKFDFSPFYGQIDLMFIDGSHDYETVLSDSENAMRCVRSGGFIVWHDFNITHLASSAAILEICDRYGLSLSRIDATAMAVVCKS